MAARELYLQDGETLKDALRREQIEAPFGRCGERLPSTDMYQGCGTPLTRLDEDFLVCGDYPDCCRA